MGLFGRSAADQRLIDEQADEIDRLKRSIYAQDFVIARGCFRDPATQRMGKTGRVPAALYREARAHAKL